MYNNIMHLGQWTIWCEQRVITQYYYSHKIFRWNSSLSKEHFNRMRKHKERCQSLFCNKHNFFGSYLVIKHSNIIKEQAKGGGEKYPLPTARLGCDFFYRAVALGAAIALGFGFNRVTYFVAKNAFLCHKKRTFTFSIHFFIPWKYGQTSKNQSLWIWNLIRKFLIIVKCFLNIQDFIGN